MRTSAYNLIQFFRMFSDPDFPMLICFMQPLGLAGAALMALSTAATYIMWRYRSQQPPSQSTTGTNTEQKSRVSIFI
jgi:hypothetical protein